MESFFKANSVAPLKLNRDFDIVALRPKANSTWVSFIEHDTGGHKLTELPILTETAIAKENCHLFYDEELNTVNFINYPDENRYSLMTISDEDLSSENQVFYTHEDYENFQ